MTFLKSLFYGPLVGTALFTLAILTVNPERSLNSYRLKYDALRSIVVGTTLSLFIFCYRKIAEEPYKNEE